MFYLEMVRRGMFNAQKHGAWTLERKTHVWIDTFLKLGVTVKARGLSIHLEQSGGTSERER